MKTILALLISCYATLASAQGVEMEIRGTTGSVLRYNVDSIEEITSTPAEAPYNRVVKIREYWGDLSFSSPIGPASGSMSFSRSGGKVYLRTPQGSTVVSEPRPYNGPGSFCEQLTFDLFAGGNNIERLDYSTTQPYLLGTAWSDTTIYTAYETIQRYTIQGGKATTPEQDVAEMYGVLGIEVNDAGTRMAFPLSGRHGWHYGKLAELDIATGRIDTLTVDSNVTSVRYFPNSDDLVYYSFGSYNRETDPLPKDAGYFKFERSTGTITPLLSFTTDQGSQELWNGFDLSHDGKKLLIPDTRSAKASCALYEYDLLTGIIDTLPISFARKNYLQTLWAQYNSNDSLILLSLTSIGSSIDRVYGGNSDVAIFDRVGKQQHPVFLSPTNESAFCAPFPRWSPDDKFICYGGCIVPVYVFEWISPFYVYIKTL